MAEKIFSGRIVNWNVERGFGFIRANSNSRSYFAHIRDWSNTDTAPAAGQEVLFEITPDDKNPEKQKASNIRVMPRVVAGADALKAGV
jgi:cold shock CspA family protein